MEWEVDLTEQIRASKWSMKRKRSIDCDNPKGFSQKQYCERQKRGGSYKSKGDESRIPEKRKDGTKRPKSEHSDLYTDEDPKGTIKGLGFKDAETARKSIKIIKNSNRKHAHKVQAMLVMIQRAKVALKRTLDSKKKKNLRAAIKVYEPAFEKLKKKKL
jgi:hypothetical protein|tara:strand:- start:83 stop:559 length:477 start_codon:yes stop_codon:yes gene_type:complete